MAEKLPGWLERVLLPQMNEMRGELKALNARMDGEFTAVHSEIRRLDEKIEGVDKRLNVKLDSLGSDLGGKVESLEKRLDVVQRLAVLEAQVGELKKAQAQVSP